LYGISLVALLPFISGCSGGGLAALGLGSLFSSSGGGGGGLAAFLGLGSLFASSGGSGGLLAFSSDGSGISQLPLTLIASGESIATIHNPEPASMLLLGGGMAAIAYFRNKKSQNNKV